MADLTQINGNQRIVMGWYGSCDDAGCEDFPLKTQEVSDAIDSVYEIHTDSTRAVAFHSYIYETMPNQTQSLESLKCGHSYYIALKSGNETLTIEEFVLADESTTQERYVTTDDQCGDGGGGGGGECPPCVKDATIAFSANPAIRNQDSFPLGFTFSVDTTSLASECSSNEWKYSLSIKDGATLKTSQQISTDTTLINDLVPGGGTYIIKIWGVTESGTLITPEPHIEAELIMPWPAANYEVQDDIDITYLEFEGPNDDSVTLSDPEGWVASATIKKSSTITNAEKWKYSLDNSTWNELTALTETTISTTATLYFRLKVGHLGGNDDTDLTTLNKSYNSEVTIAYTENNGTERELSLPLKGKVLNRIIGITSWVNNNNTDFKATLTISKNQLTRWQYQLEKLNDDEESYGTPKILTAYGSDTIQTDTSEEINLENYIRASAANNYGPGYYKISVRGLHNTDDAVVVTPELSHHDFFNWPNVLYTLNGAINNSYREYEGPHDMSTFYFVNHTYFNNWKFEIVTDADASDWEYQNSGGTITGPLPTTPTDASTAGIGFRMIEGKKASTTPTTFGENTNQAYSTDIKFYIYGKNAIPTLAEPADPVEVIKTLKTTVKERYITNISQSQTPNSSANTIKLKVNYSTTEINRTQIIWTKNTTELTDTTITSLSGYSATDSHEYTIDLNDVSSNYLTTNNNFNISVIGHSTTNTSDIHETGWIAGQVAPALEHTFTVSWPTTIFTINHTNDTISDNYIWQGVTATPATNGTSISITKGWLKLNPAGNGTSSFTLRNATGSISNWEYSTNGEDSWVSLDQLPVNFPLYTQSKFRLKANLEVGDYDATIDVVATDIQSVLHTKTINLQGSVTKPTPIFTISPTSISGEYRETEGPSAEKTISISTKFLKSVKWKSSGTISWEYQDGTTWKNLPTSYVTILNKPWEVGQAYSTAETKTIKVRLKSDLEVPGADDMDAQIESHNFNNVIAFEAISSHDVDVTEGKQVALNGTVTEYPNGCADYDLSFATTGGEVDYGISGVSLNKFQSGGHICVNNFGNSFGTKGVTLEVRDSSNNVITTGSVSTNWDWANGTNIVYKAPDQQAYEAKNFAFGQGNVILTPMNL